MYTFTRKKIEAHAEDISNTFCKLNGRWSFTVAEACELLKGEEMEWIIEDRNSFVLKRAIEAKTNLPEKKK